MTDICLASKSIVGFLAVEQATWVLFEDVTPNARSWPISARWRLARKGSLLRRTPVNELQSELARRFPITRRYGELVSVSLHNPRLALDGSANRATLASRLVLLTPLLRPSSLGGQMAVGSGLRWDASGPSVRLQDPRAEQLRIDGVTGADAKHLERISASVAQGITIGDEEIKVHFE